MFIQYRKTLLAGTLALTFGLTAGNSLPQVFNPPNLQETGRNSR
jgi:arylsulfate sulfotransferase